MALPISPSCRVISLPMRSRSAATSISIFSIRRNSPTICTGASESGSALARRRHFGQLGQRRQIGRETLHRRHIAGGDQRHLLLRADLHFAAQAAAGIDHRLELRHPGIGLGIHLGEIGLGVGRQHDRVGDLALGERRHGLPQFFGDERNQRVGEAQHRFEHAQQRAARGALLARRCRSADCTLASSTYQSQYSSQT